MEYKYSIYDRFVIEEAIQIVSALCHFLLSHPLFELHIILVEFLIIEIAIWFRIRLITREARFWEFSFRKRFERQ